MSLMDKKTLYDAKCLRRAMKVHNTVYFIHDYVCVVKSFSVVGLSLSPLFCQN